MRKTASKRQTDSHRWKATQATQLEVGRQEATERHAESQVSKRKSHRQTGRKTDILTNSKKNKLQKICSY